MNTRSRRFRWAVPVVVVAAVGGGLAATNAMSASAASPALPTLSPAQLIADVNSANLTPMSGTVVENAKLGLPALPDVTGGQGSSSLSSLISGSHTLRVWYGGPSKVRVALLGNLGESDIVANASGAWVWSSDNNTATHYAYPAQRSAAKPHRATPATPGLTPQQLAQKVLAKVSPTTKVATTDTATVAGRPAYQLVIAPRDAKSSVGSIRIAIDAATHVPLRLQVFASGATEPAIAVGFTQVSFSAPSAAQFTFSPPPGATVKKHSGAAPSTGWSGYPPERAPMATTYGSGWSEVLIRTGVSMGEAAHGRGQLATVLRGLPAVSGSWGSGHLLHSALFSALITDDGRLLIGAVSPAQLYAAAAHR